MKAEETKTGTKIEKKVRKDRIALTIIVFIIGWFVGMLTDPCYMLLVFFSWFLWLAFCGTYKQEEASVMGFLQVFASWICGSLAIFGLIMVLLSGCNLRKFNNNLQEMTVNGHSVNYDNSAAVEQLYYYSEQVKANVGRGR